MEGLIGINQKRRVIGDYLRNIVTENMMFTHIERGLIEELKGSFMGVMEECIIQKIITKPLEE